MVLFGGLPQACDLIDKEHKGFVKTFKGGESVTETLSKLNVPKDRIPKFILEGSSYDDRRMEFGADIIKANEYVNFQPVDRSNYTEYGTKKDTLVKRLENSPKENFTPLMRAHVGPYSSSASRMESVKEFLSWAKYLADTKFLDILSIGSSQLSQSNFGEDW